MPTDVNEILSAEMLSTRTLYEFYLDDIIIYLVNGVEDIVVKGKTYLSCEIKRSKFEQQIDGKPESLVVTITNRNQIWSSYIANQGNKINFRLCVVKEYFTEYPDVDPIVVFKGTMDNPQLTVKEFKVNVIRGYGEFNKTVPTMTYDVNCQWQLRDKNCKYNGAETYCDKTYTRCLYLGNIGEFGGHPSTASDSIVRRN